MSNSFKNHLFIVFSAVIYSLSVLLFMVNDNYLVIIFPICIAIVLMSVFNFKNLFFLLFFCTPISVSLADVTGLSVVDMALPTEPILFGLMILSLIFIIYHYNSFRYVFAHPITVCIILYLCWMFLTCVTSTMPIVSFKFLLSRLWYILPMFFIGSVFFQKTKNITFFILLYSVPLTLVVVYTIFKHSGYYFDKESAHYMMSPFFNDHTSYGAMIAFFIPLNIAVLFVHNKNIIIKFAVLCMLFILFIGLVLSFTRAAWLSLFLAVIGGLVLRYKINRKFLFSSPLIIIVAGFLLQGYIIDVLERNTQNTSDNLLEHTTSISNISTDASNVERINRWHCALHMFYDKPVFGWGPGTYQFQYAPFQLLKYNTVIRTNTGDLGNAHSEYLGPLAESGILGFLTFSLLVYMVMYQAVRLYYEIKNPKNKIFIFSIILSLTSYFIHGIFNNFLDTDKASIAIWGTIAMIVAIDFLNKKNKHKDSKFENYFS